MIHSETSRKASGIIPVKKNPPPHLKWLLPLSPVLLSPPTPVNRQRSLCLSWWELFPHVGEALGIHYWEGNTPNPSYPWVDGKSHLQTPFLVILIPIPPSIPFLKFRMQPVWKNKYQKGILRETEFHRGIGGQIYIFNRKVTHLGMLAWVLCYALYTFDTFLRGHMVTYHVISKAGLPLDLFRSNWPNWSLLIS